MSRGWLLVLVAMLTLVLTAYPAGVLASDGGCGGGETGDDGHSDGGCGGETGEDGHSDGGCGGETGEDSEHGGSGESGCGGGGNGKNLRYNIIEDSYSDLAGILNLQVSAGLNEFLRADTTVELTIDVLDDDELLEVTVPTLDAQEGNGFKQKYNQILNSFHNLAGIANIQMSSGTGNALVSNINVDIHVSPFLFSSLFDDCCPD